MFFEFLIEQWLLVTAWGVLLFLLFHHESRKGGQAVSPQQLSTMVNRDEALVLDVRDSKEFGKGHITESVNIPLKDLPDRLSELAKHKEKPVIVVCKMGHQSGGAGKILGANGFNQIYKLRGGLTEWTASHFPLVKS